MNGVAASIADRPRLPVVVIGSGASGLAAAAAVAANGRSALVLTAGFLTEHTASIWAQGGIAAAMDAADSWQQHAYDTWRAGSQAGQPAVIDRITQAAPAVVRSLTEKGITFDRQSDGEYDLAREGGHGRARVVHVGDHTGAAITAGLAAHVEHLSRVTIHERVHVQRLLLDAGGALAGLIVAPVLTDGSLGALSTILTDRVILATGGLGGLFPWTTNPLSARGEGIAMAARVGARTDDLHLVQFHPTALDVGADPYPLLTEALRGAGASLLRSTEAGDWTRFVDELQPRDVVAAAVWEQSRAGRRVVLDARAVAAVEQRFPAVAELVAKAGLRLRDDLLPVRPAVHYAMGGVTTDERSRTSVPGLWAVGEVARTGLHGANRLASNSLLEAVVTGELAGEDAATWRGAAGWQARVAAADPGTAHPAGAAASQATGQVVPLAQIRQLLGEVCGVLRDASGLRDGATQLRQWCLQDPTSQAAYLGWLIVTSALAHPSSLGAHRRTDDPAYVAPKALPVAV